MTIFDYAVFAILIGSIVIGIVRGVVSEVLSLAAWIIAYICAKRLAPIVAYYMPMGLTDETIRLIAAFLTIFFLVWLATALARVVLTSLVHRIGLGGINRFLGAVFGVIRGGVIIMAVMLLAGMSDLPKQPMWKQALLAKPLESVALSTRPWLPDFIANNLHYEE